jgi:hypothetical protein
VPVCRAARVQKELEWFVRIGEGCCLKCLKVVRISSFSCYCEWGDYIITFTQNHHFETQEEFIELGVEIIEASQISDLSAPKPRYPITPDVYCCMNT